MIKAVIFDCFGVLATESWIAFKDKHFGDQPEKMKRATELSRLIDTGAISYDESILEIADMAGIKPQELDYLFKNVTANDQLLTYIRKELKSTYKIGMLSNVGSDWLYSIFDKSDIALFDATALSHESGIVKPDPRAYRAIADKLGLEPQECVFVDDLQRNIEGARQFGMQAVLYEDFDQFKKTLDELLKA